MLSSKEDAEERTAVQCNPSASTVLLRSSFFCSYVCLCPSSRGPGYTTTREIVSLTSTFHVEIGCVDAGP